MIASQFFLSSLGIPYNGNMARPIDQKSVNEVAGAILVSYQAIQSGTYTSPATLPLPAHLPGLILKPGQAEVDAIAALVNTEDVNAETPFISLAVQTAWNAYLAACATGNLKAVHETVDGINALNPITGYRPFVPRPDLLILRSVAGIIGQMAQQCGPDGNYFVEWYTYGPDPATEALIKQALAPTPVVAASMLPTVFFS